MVTRYCCCYCYFGKLVKYILWSNTNVNNDWRLPNRHKTAFTGRNWKLRNKRRTFQSVKGQQLRNRNVSLTKRWPLHASWSQVWLLYSRCVAADLATSLRCSVFVNILPSDKFARNNCNVYKDQHVSRVIADTFLAEWCMSVSLLILQKKLSRSELQEEEFWKKKQRSNSEQCYKCLS